MAGKGWTTQIAAASGVAAGMGAAQLGLGYGLGVVVWPVAPTLDDSVWLGSLGWATWIAASATVFGAVIAARLRGAQAPRLGGPWRSALAAAAAVGALLTVVLVAVPARPAVRADTFAPEMIAGGYAMIGIVLGLVIAYWAVVSRAVAANLFATAGYLWTLAAAGIVVELTLRRESATYLTSWQFAEQGTEARYGTIYWPSALLTLLAALVIGMIAAWPSVRAGNLGIGTASSGAVGPLLVAAAFLVLAPQLTGALGQLESAYLIAPYAVLAGLAGSALVVASGRRSAQRRAARIARIHRPAPPAATGKAAVPAQSDTSQTDTPPMGLPQVPAARPRQRSGRAKPSTASAPAASAPEPDQPPVSSGAAQTADSGPADEGEPKASERPGLWDRLRRGGRVRSSDAADQAEAITTLDPAVARSSAARSGSSSASPPAQRAASPRASTAAASPPPDRLASQAADSRKAGATDPRDRRTAGAASQPPAQSGATDPRTRPGDPPPGKAGATDPRARPAGAGNPPPSKAGATDPRTRPARADNPPPTTAGATDPRTRPTSQATSPPAKGRATDSPSRPASQAAGPPAKGRATDPDRDPKANARSTVAAPPAAPPIAKINPPREADPKPGSKPSRPTGEGNVAPPKAAPAKPQPEKSD